MFLVIYCSLEGRIKPVLAISRCAYLILGFVRDVVGDVDL